MSQLDNVATWVALIAGVIGITLLIVAIWFTFTVESRSRRVTEQSIQSLQKIESSVERSSADTQGLIKVAWDKMVGGATLGISEPSEQTSDADTKQIALGLAEEIRSDLRTGKDGSSPPIDEDRIVERVSEAIQGQLQLGHTDSVTPSSRVDRWVRTLQSLSPASYELIRFIGNYGTHLTKKQYNNLVSSGYGSAIKELRQTGLLTPLRGKRIPDDQQPVYWFPPGESSNIHIAQELVGRDYPSERSGLRGELAKVDYIKRGKLPRGWARIDPELESYIDRYGITGPDGGEGSAKEDGPAKED